MNSEPEWNQIRTKAAQRLPSDFARATIRRAQQQRRTNLRVRSALLTAAILFLVVNAGHSFGILPTAAQAPASTVASSQDSAEWAQLRMGVDL